MAFRLFLLLYLISLYTFPLFLFFLWDFKNKVFWRRNLLFSKSVIIVHAFDLRSQEREAGGSLSLKSASMLYITHSRTARSAQGNTVSKKRNFVLPFLLFIHFLFSFFQYFKKTKYNYITFFLFLPLPISSLRASSLIHDLFSVIVIVIQAKMHKYITCAVCLLELLVETRFQC